MTNTPQRCDLTSETPDTRSTARCDVLSRPRRSRPEHARRCDQAEALETLDGKLAAARQRRGRRLLVDTVLAEVPDERRPAFDRLCLLEQPLPSDELTGLLGAEGLA